MLLKIKKTFRFQNLLKLFLLYFLLQTGLGNLHKHKELNLHFHAENLLTADHTTAADRDCPLCEIIIHTSNYLFDPIKNSSLAVSSHTYYPKNNFGFVYSKSIFIPPGRAPPIQNS
jgi:hypothetical protein